MKNKLLLSILLVASVFGCEMKVDAATSGIKAENKKITVTTNNTRLYRDSKMKSYVTVKKGTVYQVNGYRLINGKHVYRLYQEDSQGNLDYKGYMYNSNAKTLTSQSTSGKYITKKGVNMWRNFYWSSKKSVTSGEKVYYTKCFYILGNGTKYYSMYYKDSSGKEQWAGYTHSSNVAPLKATTLSKPKYVTLKQDYTTWNSLYFKQKKNFYKVSSGTNFKVDKYYMLNGKKYYSTYRNDSSGKEYWTGYANQCVFEDLGKVAPSSDEKYLKLKEDITTYSNHFYNKKVSLPSGTQLENIGYYTYGNGKRYYSVNMSGKWVGYVPQSSIEVTSEPKNPYFINKDIDDTKAKIIVSKTNPETIIYKDPIKKIKTGKTTANYKNKEVTYLTETYTAYGDYVNVSGIGWIDRRSLVDNNKIPKMADKEKNYTVWTTPGSKERAKMDSFENGALEVDQVYKVPSGDEYYHLIVNGGTVGWVNSTFVKANYIGLPKRISLVRSYNNATENYNPRHALTGLTDSSGTILSPFDSKLSVIDTSKPEAQISSGIDTSKPGVKNITYNIGNNTKKVEIKVRDSQMEGATSVDGTPDDKEFSSGKSSMIDHLSAPLSFSTSPNYKVSEGKIVETKANIYSGGTPNYKFTTNIFAPTWLGQGRGNTNFNNSINQGLTIINDTAYLSVLQDNSTEVGRIISYNLKKVGSLGDLRQLRSLADQDFNKFKTISENIKVSGLFYVGHGQGLTTDGTHLYFVPSEYRVSSSADLSKHQGAYDQISQINPQSFDVEYTDTLRILAKYGNNNQNWRNINIFNLAMVDSNTFYTISRPSDRMEIWKVECNSDGSYQSERVMMTKSYFGIKTTGKAPSPQGMAYNRAQNAVYCTTNSAFVGYELPQSNSKGRMIAAVKLNTNRESEGIAFSSDGMTMYMGMNRGVEVLSAIVPKSTTTINN